MITPVTLPVTVAFCFLLVVPLALRVAAAFADRAARARGVRGVGFLRGVTPRAASVVGELAKAPARFCLTTVRMAPSVTWSLRSWATASAYAAFAWTTALAAARRP